jgi:ATP-dependent RNA helicase HelY
MMAFEPDAFQVEATEAIRAGESVVVAAPTGSGKTYVAEVAIREALAREGKAFYTTPLKALSNQKFHDFLHLFPSVGLLTGDNSIAAGAPVVVMTTEVLRNMIYSNSDLLEGLRVVVLDEVHYLQDPARGGVWEEVIIHTPPSAQFVCLSATVSNASEFATWVRARRGPTRLIQEHARPVPLVNLYALKDRWGDDVVFEPMFSKGRVNDAVDSRISGSRARRYGTPRRNETVEALAAKGMLPAIYFIFSRAGCTEAARRLAATGVRFTDAAERDAIRTTAEARTAHLGADDLEALGYGEWLGGLLAGVAPHHAGMVPAFKEAVEDLFARGLTKVVFATETLSLGINMPARTVVLERLSRFTGEAHEPLLPGDYTQLTGRAGRRGIDEVGYGVVLHSRFIPFTRVAELAAAGSHALQSSFRPSYNMAVNLIANHPRERAEELLNASFGQFQATKTLRSKERAVALLEHDLEALRGEATCQLGDVAEYRMLLTDAAPEHLRRGDVIDVRTGPMAGRYVVMKRLHGRRVELMVLSEHDRVERLRHEDARRVIRLGTVHVPEHASFRAAAARAIKSVVSETDHPVSTCPDRSRHLDAYDKVVRLERRLDKLRNDLERARGGLVRELDRILDLLEGRGYVHGWSLTPDGQRLRSLYGELDLLLSEAIRAGLLEDLEPPEIAALVSMAIYEARRVESASVRWPSEKLEERGGEMVSLWSSIVRDERGSGLAASREPDPGFASLAYRWAAGEDLAEVLGTTEAGDFVRTCRQLLDALRQMRDAAPHLREPITQAIRTIDRGVVASPQ